MSTLTATQLQQQYIAYFGRPGDPAGIKYWLSSSSGISSAREFADKIYAQDEYKKSTVGAKSTEAQVNSLYQNLFGRAADAAGLIYWTGEIEAGTLTLSNIAYDLIAAASNPVAGNEAQGAADALALSNKVAAAEAFTADVEASTDAILAYQPETSTPWVTGAAFESGKSYLAGITTTAHTAAGIDSAVASMITANTSAGSTAASTTSKFTTSQDVLAGGAGNDIFNGVVVAGAATGTTAQPGDQIDGGAGTDTLNISFSGTTGGTPYTLEAVDTDKVEEVLVSNYETSADETTVSATLFDSSLTTVGLSSSAATGDTTFTNLSQLVDAEMRNGSGDLTLTYNAAVVAGTADVQKLTVSATTAGTFDADNAETLDVVAETAGSKLTNISSTGLTKLNISGDQTFEVTTALTTKTIDASANTGGVTLTLGTANQTVTGGSGDDTIDGAAAVTNDDTIKGGAGSDTLKLTIGASTYDGELDDELYNVSEFETIQVKSTADTATVELDTLWTGITDLKALANTGTYTITAVANSTAIAGTLNGVAFSTAATDASATTTEAAVLVAGVITALSGFTATSSGAVVSVTADTTKVIEFGAISGGATAATFAYPDVSFVDAAGTETLTINTGDNVTYNLLDASGSADVANVNITPYKDDTKLNQTIGDVTIANTETLQLGVTGLHDDYTFTLSNVSGDASLTTLNITGDSNFTLSDHASDNSKLATIDASTFTNDLTFSDAVATLAQTLTTGTGNDTWNMSAGTLTEDDVIDLGGNTVLADGTAGTDTVAHTGNLGSAVDDSVLQIKNVEAINLTATSGVAGAIATYIDASKMSGNGTIAFASGSGTAKIKNLDTTTKIGLGIAANDFTGTLDVALADETGTADSISLVESSTLGAASTITFKSTGIETLNIETAKATKGGVSTTFTFGENAPAKIVATKGNAADTLALGTLNKNTTEVDAGSANNIVSLTAATDVAMTVSVPGAVANNIVLSGGDDTVTMGKAGTSTPTLTASTGTDTLNITLNSALSDFTSVSGFEVLNLTIPVSTATGFGDATDDAGLNDTNVNTINVLGGNSLSTFTIGGTDAVLDDGTYDYTVDASTFAGAIDIIFAEDAFDGEVTIKGGVSADDKVRLTGSDATDEKPASMTGIETLVVNTKNNTTAGVIDLTNVTGLTKLEVDFTNATNADTVTINKIASGVTVYVDSTQTADNLVLGLTDAASSSTALTIEIDDVEAGNDVVDLDIAGVETLTIQNDDSTHLPFLNLAGVSATGTSGVTTLNLVGSAVTLKALNEDITTIDATAMTGALTLGAADRESNAMTITSSTGDDSIAMEHKNDVIDAKTGTDTLDIRGTGVLGGLAIDLTSATDQVTQYGGVANSASQKGFEHVDFSNYAGSFGGDVTGSDLANTITTNGQNSIVDGGKGNDTLTGGAGADTLTGGAGNDIIAGGDGIDTINAGTGDDVVEGGAGADNDTINLSTGTDTITVEVNTAVGVDTITGFTPGTDNLDIAALDTHFTATPKVATLADAAGALTSLQGSATKADVDVLILLDTTGFANIGAAEDEYTATAGDITDNDGLLVIYFDSGLGHVCAAYDADEAADSGGGVTIFHKYTDLGSADLANFAGGDFI